MIILKITVISLLLKDFKLRTEETDTERAGRRDERSEKRDRDRVQDINREEENEITYL